MEVSTEEKNIRMVTRLIPLIHQKIGSVHRRVNDQDKFLYHNQLCALMIIGSAGKITNSELGEMLYIKKSSVTTLVDSLIEKELVTRENDDKDRRKTWIYLTEEGMTYRDEQYALIQQEISKILGKLSEEDMNCFFEGVEKTIRILEKL